MARKPVGVLFVCLGNICRSPLAEAIFLHKGRERGVLDRFDVDSAGTGGWHEGERADPRTIEIAARFGIEVPSRARKVRAEDYSRFDLLLAMDQANMQDLLAGGASEEQVRLMRSFDPQYSSTPPWPDVPDPYYGGDDGFLKVYRMLDASVEGLLEALTRDTA